MTRLLTETQQKSYGFRTTLPKPFSICLSQGYLPEVHSQFNCLLVAYPVSTAALPVAGAFSVIFQV
ncbi:hypothetical protein QUB47_22375 [Microcoleus sp. AT9_B5]